MSKHDYSHGELIERYNANERSNHWVTAISFVLLALSGLAMFHPALFWLSALFGGGQWTRILHPFIGIVMFISFALLALRFWHHNVLDRDDVRWLRQIDDVVTNREDRLPEVGRYNAGQKLLFFVLVACLLLLLLSGIVIWRRYFSAYFPIGHHRPHLCGDLGQGLDGRDAARYRDARLGAQAPPALVSRRHQSVVAQLAQPWRRALRPASKPTAQSTAGRDPMGSRPVWVRRS
jgi:formate dehydrogenase subunit gamma